MHPDKTSIRYPIIYGVVIELQNWKLRQTFAVIAITTFIYLSSIYSIWERPLGFMGEHTPSGEAAPAVVVNDNITKSDDSEISTAAGNRAGAVSTPMTTLEFLSTPSPEPNEYPPIPTTTDLNWFTKEHQMCGELSPSTSILLDASKRPAVE
ncbi:hypothetical protein BKA69DRAFT_1127995 [Paraphysoderma sedebokerense]|nr:hypothetical protein BKA69DRAFT_1127995 [Paraphysoderma sedebokerense]